MDHGSQPKPRLAYVTFAPERVCLNRPGSMLSIMSQRQDPEILIYFFVIRVYYEKLGHMVKPFMPKFLSDLSVRSRDITENQVPTTLKPMVGM